MHEVQKMQLSIVGKSQEKRPLTKSEWEGNKWKHKLDCSGIVI
jgi:hypothetical protein